MKCSLGACQRSLRNACAANLGVLTAYHASYTQCCCRQLAISVNSLPTSAEHSPLATCCNLEVLCSAKSMPIHWFSRFLLRTHRFTAFANTAPGLVHRQRLDVLLSVPSPGMAAIMMLALQYIGHALQPVMGLPSPRRHCGHLVTSIVLRRTRECLPNTRFDG